jgi:LCP family protein required for cell wall assembly
MSGGQSDVMFLLVVDNEAGKLKVIAINRNTMCLVDTYDRNGTYIGQEISQLCLQHAYGDGMGTSCRRSVEAVERLFYNIPVSGYIAMNLDGIKPLNHSVGGVTVTVEEDYTTANGNYEFRAGETVTLSDDEAYAFIRSRDLDEFASADARLARQISYLNAMIGQMKEQMAARPGKAASIYKAVEDYTVASIDAVSLAEKISDYGFEDEDMLKVPGETRMGSQFEEYHIDEGAFYDLIMDVFYTELPD